MVEIFKITGKRIVFVGAVITVIGMILCGYHLLIWDMIHGKWPDIGGTQIAVGSLLMTLGPWIIKGRSMVKRSVQ